MCIRDSTISWQNGPLGRGNDRKEPNGAFVEDVLAAIIGRILFYQRTKFQCPENDEALRSLLQAAQSLDNRTKKRESRQVEGTYDI